MTRNAAIERAIAAIDYHAWTPVRYPGAVIDPDTGEWISDAEVAEIPYTAFASTSDAITARLVVRRVKDARYRDALFPVWRYHPFFANTGLPVEQADITHRQHAIIETVFADLIDGRWRTYPRVASAPMPPGSCARRSPTTCCALRRPGRRPAHPGTRIDAPPQDCHRPSPADPPATPTDPALTHPLALVQTLAYVVVQHDRIQPATIRASLIHLPKGPTETPTGKAGQTSRYSMPTARQSRSPDPAPLGQARRWIQAKPRLNRLVGLVYFLAVGPGLVLNKPPFRLPVVGPRACHHINAYRPFARSGQCADDALADDAPYLTPRPFLRTHLDI